MKDKIQGLSSHPDAPESQAALSSKPRTAPATIIQGNEDTVFANLQGSA
jgi:hypothetical protein